MNVIQRPRPREFCATMQDYIIDTEVSVTFAVEYGGKKILDEEYVPDANNQVRVRNLGKFCELALWGVWCPGYVAQSNASGTFTFLINDLQDSQSEVIFSRMQTRKDAASPGVLSEVSARVTRPGAKEYVSGFPLDGGYTLTVTRDDGTSSRKKYSYSTTELFSVDVSPEKVADMLPGNTVVSYLVEMSGGSMLFYVDRTRYADLWCFRFKNVYDMPETLTATGELKLTGNNESDAAAMYGVQRKFGVKVTDEYTVNSGVILMQSDYKLWHNLLNAQEVEIYAGGEWLPILITKQKFERSFRRSVLKAVEFSFVMANPEQNNLIAL